MQRRSFLRTVAAAIMVPCVQLRREVDRESLMLAFCDTEQASRYDFDQPFSVGSLTYSTDSRHMVRAELVNRLDCGERRLPRGVEDVWNSYWHPRDWRPFELPPMSVLIKHRNEGICPECGDRWIPLGDKYPSEEEVNDRYMGLSYDVDTNSIRDASCPLCHGRTYYGPHCVEVCGVLMTYHRLKPIAAIPGVMVAANRLDDPDSPLLFRGSGIDGIAMGLARD